VIGLVFYALWIVLSFCIVATVLVLYAAFWTLAIITAVVIEVARAIVQRRRLKRPPVKQFKRPIPQPRWSNRR
jgi:membrane protein implicated in regulation of membrane protease activity